MIGRKGPAPGSVRHGLTDSPTYQSWRAMIKRTLYQSSKDYARYGGVGIGITERWLTFSNFLQDMGVKPDGTTIDRIDGAKGYEPNNCRWATPKQQSANRKNTVFVSTPVGVMPLVDYAAMLGMHRRTTRHRLERGELVGCVRIERRTA